MITKPKNFNYSIVILLLAGIVSITYNNLSGHTFLYWDDIEYVINNPHYKSMSLYTVVEIFTDFSQVIWHPITSLSYIIDFSLWSDKPLYFKIVNISIHIINSFLVYLICLRVYFYINLHRQYTYNPTFRDSQVATFSLTTAIIFAVHPQHVESIVWIVERKDLLCALFYFLSILSYFNQNSSINSAKWRNLTAIFFVLALMSKPMAVTLPLTLILIDLFVLRNYPETPSLNSYIQYFIKNKIVLFCASLVFSLVTLTTQSDTIASNVNFGLFARIINAVISINHYLVTTLFPLQLSPFYPIDPLISNISTSNAIPLIAFTLLLVALFVLYKRNIVYPLYSYIYFIVALLPVLGIIKVGHAGFADRYTYIPSVSIYLLLGYTLSYFATSLDQVWRKVFIFLPVIFIIFLASITHTYIPHWKNDNTLWSRVIRLYPYQSYIPYLNLGAYYYLNNDNNKALKYYKKALEHYPGQIDVLRHVAMVYYKQRNHKLANEINQRIIRYNPNDVKAYLVVGDNYAKTQGLLLAEPYYEKAFSLAPLNIYAIIKSAKVDFMKGDIGVAREKLKNALKLKNNEKSALVLMAQIELKSGNIDDAVNIANKIHELDSNDEFSDLLIKMAKTRNSGN